MSAVQPGWYPDPSDPGRLRYHDGSAWTEHVHVSPPTTPPPTPTPTTAPTMSATPPVAPSRRSTVTFNAASTDRKPLPPPLRYIRVILFLMAGYFFVTGIGAAAHFTVTNVGPGGLCGSVSYPSNSGSDSSPYGSSSSDSSEKCKGHLKWMTDAAVVVGGGLGVLGFVAVNYAVMLPPNERRRGQLTPSSSGVVQSAPGAVPVDPIGTPTEPAGASELPLGTSPATPGNADSGSGWYKA